MFKDKVTYTDYNGVEREEEFFFNLNEAELFEMQNSVRGGLTEKVKKIMETKNTPEIIKLFKEIMQMSYGVKSDDGRRFIKNKEVLDEFTQTEAYSKIYMKLATDSDYAAKFINEIIPKEISDRANGVTVLPGTQN